MNAVEATRKLAGQRAIKIGIQLKFLDTEDKPRVKELCRKFFPIDYPEKWYNDVTSDKKYFALSAVYRGLIVGVIIAEVKPKTALNPDDSDILATSCPAGSKVAYLLSLGVEDEYRENGIGSLLMDSLMTEVKSGEKDCIKAVYLHVLCANSGAIQFYERRDFIQHKRIPAYYNIDNKAEDGFCYVRYINGGQPPWSVADYMRQVTSVLTKLNSCSTTSHHHHHHHYVQRQANPAQREKDTSSKPWPLSKSSQSKSESGNQQSNPNTPLSGSPPTTNSVQSYANVVLNKLPRLLPTSFPPKISSLFSSSQSQPQKSTGTSATQNQKGAETSMKGRSVVASDSESLEDIVENRDGEKLTSATGAKFLSVPNFQDTPVDTSDLERLSLLDKEASVESLTELSPRVSLLSATSSSEEFHDSLSSLSQLHLPMSMPPFYTDDSAEEDETCEKITRSPLPQGPELLSPLEDLDLAEQMSDHIEEADCPDPEFIEAQPRKHPGNRLIANAMNPVNSLIASTMNQKRRLRASFSPMSRNQSGDHKSCLNSLGNKQNKHSHYAVEKLQQMSTRVSSTRKAVKMKSALTKGLARIKPVSPSNFLDDEQVLQSRSNSGSDQDTSWNADTEVNT